MSSSESAGFSKSRATIDSVPFDVSIVNSAASAPSLLQVTSPIGVPVSVGAGAANAAFSTTVRLDRPVIPRLAVSLTSRIVTVIATVAVFSSSSVTVTVTS